MKIILLAVLVSLTLSNSLFFRPSEEIKPISGSAPQCISDYQTALFAHFGLDQPNDLINCFDEKSAALYFAHVFEVANLVQDQEHRERLHVHLDLVGLLILDKSLENLWGCISQTQDFANLLKALGCDGGHDGGHGWIVHYIYLQSSYGKLAGELPQVTGALSNKNFKAAGDLAGGILNSTVNDVRSQGVALLALNGLWNGVHIALGLPDAASVGSCWNNDTATIRLEFIWGLANAVANGKPQDAAQNTENWYEQTGNNLVAQIPQSAWECWAKSSDTQSESQVLGIDITTQAFYQKVSTWVHSHQLVYWGLQKGIQTSLEHHNFLHAGSGYGQLLQLATK